MWLRLYTELLNDPKAQRLPGEQFKGWINLLCIAKEHGGLIPPIEDIAFQLRMSDGDAKCLVEELVKRGLLDTDGKNVAPHNWHVRQFESDNSTERVKRFRNVSETLPEQIQSRTEPDTEQSRVEASREKPRSVRTPVLPDDEFLDGLQKNPAYSMLNVRHCYQRMMTWCQVNSKQPSRRRFINWLNREDKPMTAKVSKNNGNAYVGKSEPLPDGITQTMLGKFGDAPDSHMFAYTPPTDAQMSDFIDDLIEANDFDGIGEQYDLIVKRGGAKAEWEIRCVAWFELHKQQAEVL